MNKSQIKNNSDDDPRVTPTTTPATRALEAYTANSAARGGKRRQDEFHDRTFDMSDIFQITASAEDQNFDFPTIAWISDDESECRERKITRRPKDMVSDKGSLVMPTTGRLREDREGESFQPRPRLLRSIALASNLMALGNTQEESADYVETSVGSFQAKLRAQALEVEKPSFETSLSSEGSPSMSHSTTDQFPSRNWGGKAVNGLVPRA